jgi:hypothetical protein
MELAADSRGANVDRNELEMRWCHIFVDPICYGQLLEELSMAPPDTKLALPRFVMTDRRETHDDDTPIGRPSDLSDAELDKIDRRLEERDARRRKIDPRSITLLADGVVRAELDLTEKIRGQIVVEAGASLIEIQARDDQGDVLLATHLIPYDNNTFEFSRGEARTANGTLHFTVMPIKNTDGRGKAVLNLSYRPKRRMKWLLHFAGFKGHRRAIIAHAFVGLTIALIGWGAAIVFYSHRITLLERQLKQAQDKQPLPPVTAHAIVYYALTRDDERVRVWGMPGPPEISLRLHSPAIGLDLPLANSSQWQTYNAELQTFSGEQNLLTLNFLRAISSNNGTRVEIVVPSDLLKPDTYYTVHLRSSDRTDNFTFKVVR